MEALPRTGSVKRFGRSVSFRIPDVFGSASRLRSSGKGKGKGKRNRKVENFNNGRFETLNKVAGVTTPHSSSVFRLTLGSQEAKKSAAKVCPSTASRRVSRTPKRFLVSCTAILHLPLRTNVVFASFVGTPERAPCVRWMQTPVFFTSRQEACARSEVIGTSLPDKCADMRARTLSEGMVALYIK